jgi:hypothetical protein
MPVRPSVVAVWLMTSLNLVECKPEYPPAWRL